MASDPKASPETASPVGATSNRGQGIRIFTYPKVIFIFPTLIISLVCGIGMKVISDETADPIRVARARQLEHQKTVKVVKEKNGRVVAKNGTAVGVESNDPDRSLTDVPPVPPKHQRFKTAQNLFGILFLAVFAFNLLIMGLDFPRFTVVGILLLALFGLFFVLWLGAYFQLDLMHSVYVLMGGVYVVANAEFYFMIAAVLFLLFVVIYLTRWLDYWEILPNEILHHHGPLSDLERLPTLNLKFDKEIPDVLEYLFLGSGRLVLHVSDERKSIVLDNVLWISHKEEMLKRLMSRLEVRITTDQEVAEDRP